MSKTARPLIVDVDMAEVHRRLAHARTVLGCEDADFFEGLAQTLQTMMQMVRRAGTTIAQLRRLLGWSSSEKTADVLQGTPSGQPTDLPAAPSSGASAPASSSDEAERSGVQSNGAPSGGEGEDRHPDHHNGGDPSSGHGKRKGHGRISACAYQGARHVGVPHQHLRPGDTCPGCTRGKVYRLPEPARIMRIIGQPPLAANCWDCERLRCASCGLVYTAQAPQEAQGPKYSESAASMMALLRYGGGMPLNRLARLQHNLETPIPASTQWEVARDRASALRPVHDELCRQAASGRVLHNDDTYTRILEFMGKRRAALLARGELPDPDRTGLFTTGIIAITDAGPIALFFTGRKHAGENLNLLLADRDSDLSPPIQMCDGLDRNVPKDHEVLQSNCLAHGRRHIVDEVPNFPDECGHVLRELRKVFRTEAKCRKRGLTGYERLRLHQHESQPVMTDLEQWLKAQLHEKRVEENSGLGKAYQHLLDHWERFTLFLRVPDAPIENNIVERALKIPIRHRNASLFYRTQRGARVGDMYMALIYTAELHGANSFEYLTTLLQHEAEVANNPAAWLPWNYRATLASSTARAA
jgi:transposase